MFNRTGLILLTLLLASGSVYAKSKKKDKPPVKPRFDDPSIPFRMAPMPSASRSIAVSLLPELHLAFDTENCRTHTAWSGKGLHLLGPQYSLSKRPFISTNDAPVLWTMPPWSPWSAVKPINKAEPLKAHYRAVSSKGEHSTFIYDLIITGDEEIRIRETPRGVLLSEGAAIVRHIEIGPAEHELWFAAHCGFGKVSKQPNGFRLGKLTAALRMPQTASIRLTSYDANFDEEVFTEEGAEKGNPIVHREGRLATAWIHIPARNHAVTIEIATITSSLSATKVAKAFAKASPARAEIASTHQRVPSATGFSMSRASTPSYRAEPFQIPAELEMLVTGMNFMPNGDLAVCTWLGDIYLIHDPDKRISAATYTRFASGLCEPMGLAVKDGAIHVGMKNELGRVIDTDGDGTADRVERIRSDWSYTGHYNAFSYGPVIDLHGDFVLANAGHSGRWDAKYTGWAFRVAANGSKLTPICSGLREPNGIGVFGPDRDVFVTDNQGSWIGACRLDHVAQGKFHGHPSGWPSKEENYGKHTAMDPPALWFPYKLCRSATDIMEITSDKFGPFKGQLLVGGFQNAIVMRVMLEKVNGEYQGAVWPFLKRFQSGVNRMAFGPDGSLYVGGCQRTWASVATKEAAIERVRFTGKVPFEVKTVHVKPDGFELSFTTPVDPKTAGDSSAYDVLQYRLDYHKEYGSPEYDHDGKKDSATAIDVTSATVSADGLTVRLKLGAWRTGYVTMVRSLDVRDSGGKKLVNNTFWYTLNSLPKS